MKGYIAFCSHCKHYHIDTNYSNASIEQELNTQLTPLEYSTDNKAWECPCCKTDAFLSDVKEVIPVEDQVPMLRYFLSWRVYIDGKELEQVGLLSCKDMGKNHNEVYVDEQVVDYVKNFWPDDYQDQDPESGLFEFGFCEVEVMKIDRLEEAQFIMLQKFI